MGTNNMNSGYVGWSMSRRAAAAYADGEMPLSRWTKGAILEAIQEWEEETGRTADKAGTKAELINRYLRYSSYHHTSKFVNITYFYSLSEDCLIQNSRESTPEELEAREREQEEEFKKHQEELEEMRRDAEEWERMEEEKRQFSLSHGYQWGSWWHWVTLHPEDIQGERVSKKGNTVLDVQCGGCHFSAPEVELKRVSCPGFKD